MNSRHGSNIGQGGLLALVQKTFRPLQMQAMQRAVRLQCDISSDCPSPSMGPQLTQTLHLLLQRAMDQSPEGGEITVTARLVNGRVELEVADEGPSCEREERSRWRQGAGEQPFERALAALMREGCQVRAFRCAAGGTAFTLFMPARAMRAAA